MGHDPGEALTTVQMIEKHIRIAKELGRPIATTEDARRILKIGVTYHSAEETLLNLGLPPNREAGQSASSVTRRPTEKSDLHRLADQTGIPSQGIIRHHNCGCARTEVETEGQQGSHGA